MVSLFRRKTKAGSAEMNTEAAMASKDQPQDSSQTLQQQQKKVKSRFPSFGGSKSRQSRIRKQMQQEEEEQQRQQEEEHRSPDDTTATDDDQTRDRSTLAGSTIGAMFGTSFENSTAGRGSDGEYSVGTELELDGKSCSSGGVGSWFKSSDDDISNIEVVYKDYGEDAGELLKLVLHDAIPEPRREDDVVVKVEASTVSLTDCIIRRGMWYESVSRPTTPGFDLVGTVHSIGREVSDFKEGDRVAAIVRTGGNARYATVPEDSLVSVPRGLDPSRATCVISTYMTAFQALEIARAKRDSLQGAKVLITGGNGSIGQALIELAKCFGCKDIYAAASEKYHARLKYGLGATCLPSDPRFWLPQVEGQMDIVIDSICRDGYDSPKRALSEDGQLVCIGQTAILYSSDQPGYFGPPAQAIWASMKANMLMTRTTTFEVWESFKNDPEKFKDDMEYLFSLLKDGQIKPNVVKQVRLSEVAEAHRTIESCGVSGQIVCLPWKKFPYKKPHGTGTGSDARKSRRSGAGENDAESGDVEEAADGNGTAKDMLCWSS